MLNAINRARPIGYRRLSINLTPTERSKTEALLNQNGESPFDAQAFAANYKALGHPAQIQIVEHLKTIQVAIDHIGEIGPPESIGGA